MEQHLYDHHADNVGTADEIGFLPAVLPAASLAWKGLRALTGGRGRARAQQASQRQFGAPQPPGFGGGQRWGAPQGRNFYPVRSADYIGYLDLDDDDEDDEIGGYGDDLDLGPELFDIDQQIGALMAEIVEDDDDEDDEIGGYDDEEPEELEAEIGALFGKRRKARRLQRRIARASKRRQTPRRRKRLARRRKALSKVQARIKRSQARKQARLAKKFPSRAKKSRSTRSRSSSRGGSMHAAYDIPEGDFTPYPLVNAAGSSRITSTMAADDVDESFALKTKEIEYAVGKPRAIHLVVTVTSLGAGAAAPVDTPSGTVTLSSIKIAGGGELVYGDEYSAALVQQSETQAVAVISIRSLRAEAVKKLKDSVRLSCTLAINTGAHANNSFQVEATGAVYCDASDVQS